MLRRDDTAASVPQGRPPGVPRSLQAAGPAARGGDAPRSPGQAALAELRAALADVDARSGGGSRGGGSEGGSEGGCAVAPVGDAGAPTRRSRERGRPYVPRVDGDVEEIVAGAIEPADRSRPLDEEVRAMNGDPGRVRLRRGPVDRRRNPPGSQTAADPFIPLALSDFHDLRRLGLFGDDGRNPPPSWWTR